MKYRLLSDRFEHLEGTIVYGFDGYDYGLRRDDEAATGERHNVVSLVEYEYPFFTVPSKHLERVIDDE